MDREDAFKAENIGGGVKKKPWNCHKMTRKFNWSVTFNLRFKLSSSCWPITLNWLSLNVGEYLWAHSDRTGGNTGPNYTYLRKMTFRSRSLLNITSRGICSKKSSLYLDDPGCYLYLYILPLVCRHFVVFWWILSDIIVYWLLINHGGIRWKVVFTRF